MKILISACLTGRNCKYNGGNNLNEELLTLLESHEIIEVCPEVMGGLPCPRPPAEILNNKALTELGTDVTREFKKGAMLTLNIAQRETPHICILKRKSPSCGKDNIYDGTFSNKLIRGSGITADLLINKAFTVFDEIEAIDYLKERDVD